MMSWKTINWITLKWNRLHPITRHCFEIDLLYFEKDTLLLNWISISNHWKTVIGFGRPGAHFDMIHNHMTWNENFVKDHMPIDTFKFSIIRHPVSHLTSSWKYFFQSAHHVRARKIFREGIGVITGRARKIWKFWKFEDEKIRKIYW